MALARCAGHPGGVGNFGHGGALQQGHGWRAEAHHRLPDVVVDAAKVQESGLIKDTIILDMPDEAGDFDTVLVRRATDKLKESTDAWAEYAKQQEEPQTVLPLMVLQVPNTPDPNDIGRALDTIYQQWPELPGGSVAHVLGDHTPSSSATTMCRTSRPNGCRTPPGCAC
jgi:hypothetical protein